ncbi:MAG: hypothetical protein ACSLEN_14590 [Candidatus Malihini olakiniferum]
MPRIHLQRIYDTQLPFVHPAFLVDKPGHAEFEKSDWKARSVKEVAPRTPLCQTFHAAPDAWDVFIMHYRTELAQQSS